MTNFSNAIDRRLIEQILRNRCLIAAYQPVVNHVKEQVVAFEALCRPWWRESIRPDVFFERAVRFGISYEADIAAIQCALDMFWYKPAHIGNSVLSVNALPITLMNPHFLTDLEQMLVRSGTDPYRLVLEITETVPYDSTALIDTVQILQGMGIRIALDDVGQGSSSLTAIANLEPDFIKIDRSLIEGMAHSPKKLRVVSALVRYMGDGQGIVAEGIENLEDLLAVTNVGVQLSQGYYWGKSMHVNEIDRLHMNIELKRFSMYKLNQMDGFPLSAPRMMEKSKEIDALVNEVLKRDFSHGMQ